MTKEIPNEYPYIAQAFKSMYKGQIDRNASCEKVEQFYEEAMTRLRLVIPSLIKFFKQFDGIFIYKFLFLLFLGIKLEDFRPNLETGKI